jgi:DNA-directed RNA polymerase specialized sigma24 family protein
VLGFSHLLDRLDADADRAAAAYEQLRLALEKFFDWHGVWPPEECADETLDRLARKLDAGAPIDDVRRYAHGIARLVLLEWQRRPVAVSMSEGGALENLSAPPAVEDNEPVQECFDRCLAALPAPLRTLVLEYYVDERRTKIDNRRRLARAFGLSDNALRHRVQRVRDRLERCVRACTTVAARRNQEAGPLIRVDRKGAR